MILTLSTISNNNSMLYFQITRTNSSTKCPTHTSTLMLFHISVHTKSNALLFTAAMVTANRDV